MMMKVIYEGNIHELVNKLIIIEVIRNASEVFKVKWCRRHSYEVKIRGYTILINEKPHMCEIVLINGYKKKEEIIMKIQISTFLTY